MSPLPVTGEPLSHKSLVVRGRGTLDSGPGRLGPHPDPRIRNLLPSVAPGSALRRGKPVPTPRSKGE